MNLNVVYTWYIIRVEYNWDFSIYQNGITINHSFPVSNLLTALAYIPLIFMGVLVVYYFIFFFSPTGRVEQSMLEEDRTGLNYNPNHVNLLCSTAFVNSEGTLVHYGTFVYGRNDLSGQSIRGLFFFSR